MAYIAPLVVDLWQSGRGVFSLLLDMALAVPITSI
jgi:hypothetical protein